MFAGDLAAFVIERISVAEFGVAAECADVPVLLQPPQLPVIRDVAPDQILSLATPGRAFGPEASGIDALDRRVIDLVTSFWWHAE